MLLLNKKLHKKHCLRILAWTLALTLIFYILHILYILNFPRQNRSRNRWPWLYFRIKMRNIRCRTLHFINKLFINTFNNRRIIFLILFKFEIPNLLYFIFFFSQQLILSLLYITQVFPFLRQLPTLLLIFLIGAVCQKFFPNTYNKY